MSDSWYSFECFGHTEAPNALQSGSGLVFELRVEDLDPREPRIASASCPLCGARCGLRNWWRATQSGHGSSGSWEAGLVGELNQNLERIAKALEAMVP